MEPIVKIKGMKKFALQSHNKLSPPDVLEALQRFASDISISDCSGSLSNGSETLILKLNRTKDVHTAVELTKRMLELGADEINVYNRTRGCFLRVWWD
jgi:hypothetical protein